MSASAYASSVPSDYLCLKWTEHHSTFFATADRLRRARVLTDVVLVGDDGGKFYAHRIVLTACSGYFAEMFAAARRGPKGGGGQPKPMTEVVMKDVPVAHIGRLLDFMYRGEIDVPEDELVGLLETASTLRVKGLAEKRPRPLPDQRRKKASPSTAAEVMPAESKAAPIVVEAKVMPSFPKAITVSVSNATPSVRNTSRSARRAASKAKSAVVKNEILDGILRATSAAIPAVGVNAGSNPLAVTVDNDGLEVEPDEAGDLNKDEKDHPILLGCWMCEFETSERNLLKQHYLEEHQMTAKEFKLKMNEKMQASEEQERTGASCGE